MKQPTGMKCKNAYWRSKRGRIWGMRNRTREGGEVLGRMSEGERSGEGQG